MFQLDTKTKRQAISLTPLIDVVFILLLFFMLTSSFVPWRNLQVNMATATTSSLSPQQPIQLHLKDNQAQVWVENELISFDQLASLRVWQQRFPERDFAVAAEQGVTLQTVISLVDGLKKVGIEKVSLANVLQQP